ncbi:unnamed protein product [Symbiodinium sp. CCMP2456]|nr:unnamed protein product [Symbiodinium sp. CCMP2456]
MWTLRRTCWRDRPRKKEFPQLTRLVWLCLSSRGAARFVWLCPAVMAWQWSAVR